MLEGFWSREVIFSVTLPDLTVQYVEVILINKNSSFSENRKFLTNQWLQLCATAGLLSGPPAIVMITIVAQEEIPAMTEKGKS